LGWFSIGLGLTEMLAARPLAACIGLDEGRAGLLPLMGVREIFTGLGILGSKGRPTECVWGRVAGDALDLALLGSALLADDTDKGRVTVALAAVAGVTALDLLCSGQLSLAASLEG